MGERSGSARRTSSLYDLRVMVERIEGRPVCGLAAGDYFEVTESSRLRIPDGKHFCIFAIAAALPLLAAKQRQQSPDDWLEQDSMVMCPDPYTTHPVEIAGQIAALDLVSAGRAYLGLARGAWLDKVHIPQPRPVRAMRETARIVETLLAGDLRGYRGEIFTLEPGFGLGYPRARASVPLLIGGWGARTVALAGEVGGELDVGGSANPGILPVMRSRLAVGAARAGRPAGATEIVLGAVTVVDTDGPAARLRARTAA